MKFSSLWFVSALETHTRKRRLFFGNKKDICRKEKRTVVPGSDMEAFQEEKKRTGNVLAIRSTEDEFGGETRTEIANWRRGLKH